MAFAFGERSIKNLAGVNADLVRVAHKALSLSQIDFAVKDNISNTCLFISFFNLAPMSKAISLSGNSEISRTVRQIIKSIKKI